MHLSLHLAIKLLLTPLRQVKPSPTPSYHFIKLQPSAQLCLLLLHNDIRIYKGDNSPNVDLAAISLCDHSCL